MVSIDSRLGLWSSRRRQGTLSAGQVRDDWGGCLADGAYPGRPLRVPDRHGGAGAVGAEHAAMAFRVGEYVIELYADPARKLKVDPAGREMLTGELDTVGQCQG